MKESLSCQRIQNLLLWQNARMSYGKFIYLSVFVILFVFVKIMAFRSQANTGNLLLYIFVISFCSNFYKQMTSNGSIADFLLVPATVAEKYLFLLIGVVLIPMSVMVTAMEGGILLARLFQYIPDSFRVLSMHDYLVVFLVASVTFFAHCLPQRWWVFGVSMIFGSFLIPIGIGFFKRKEVYMPVVSEVWSIATHPLVATLLSVGSLALAYHFFKQNEMCRFKKYE